MTMLVELGICIICLLLMGILKVLKDLKALMGPMSCSLTNIWSSCLAQGGQVHDIYTKMEELNLLVRDLKVQLDILIGWSRYFTAAMGMCKIWDCNCKSHQGMQQLAKDSSCSLAFLLWMVKLPNFLGAPKETVVAAFASSVLIFSSLLMTMTMMGKMASCQRLQGIENLNSCIWFLTRKFSRAGTG